MEDGELRIGYCLFVGILFFFFFFKLKSIFKIEV